MGASRVGMGRIVGLYADLTFARGRLACQSLVGVGEFSTGTGTGWPFGSYNGVGIVGMAATEAPTFRLVCCAGNDCVGGGRGEPTAVRLDTRAECTMASRGHG